MASSTPLKDRLDAAEFVITSEVTPPLSADPADLKRMAMPLKGLADAVNVTDAASSRVHMGALASASLLASWGIEPILQLACRDRNRIALQGDLLGAAALGIRNLLVLGGDDPRAGDQPDAKPVFDLDSVGLADTARRMRDEKQLPNGRAIAGSCDFLIGAADTPFDVPRDWKPDRVAAKRRAGVSFIQTQFAMDVGLVRRYIARLEEEGLVPAMRFLIGVAPLRSAKSARWMRDKLHGTVIADEIVARLEGAADPSAEGIRICTDMIAELSTIRGVAGVHVMAPRNEATIPEVISAARKQVGRR